MGSDILEVSNEGQTAFSSAAALQCSEVLWLISMQYAVGYGRDMIHTGVTGR